MQGQRRNKSPQPNNGGASVNKDVSTAFVTDIQNRVTVRREDNTAETGRYLQGNGHLFVHENLLEIPFNGDATALEHLHTVTGFSPTLGAANKRESFFFKGKGLVTDNVELQTLLTERKNKDGQNIQAQTYITKEYLDRYGNCFWQLSITGKVAVWNLIPPLVIVPLASNEWKANKYRVKKMDSLGIFSTHEDFDVFDPKKPTDGQILHLKTPTPNNLYWGLPSWYDAFKYVQNEYLLGNHHNGQLENGFSLEGMLHVDGAFNAEDAKKYKKELDESYKGAGSNGKIMLVVSQNASVAPSFTSWHNNQLDGQFVELAKLSQDQIIKSKLIPPSLLSIETAGRLGTTNETFSLIRFYYNTVIETAQQDIIERFTKLTIDLISKVEDKNLAYKELYIRNDFSVWLVDAIVPNEVMTKNEQRALLGLEELDTNGLAQLLSETQKTKNNGTSTLA